MAEPEEETDGSSSWQRDRQIVEHLPGGVAVLAPNGTIRWANEQFEHWCGRDPRGCDFFAALDLPDQDIAAFRAALAAGRPATKKNSNNTRYTTPTHTLRYVSQRLAQRMSLGVN